MNENLIYNYYKADMPKGKTVIITHGIAEYSKNYIEFKDYLVSHGYDTITYDLRGHGKDKGPKGNISSIEKLLDDLDFLVDLAYKNTEKVFLYGHSLGGVITNNYTLRRRKTDGIIISASPAKIGFLLSFLSIFPKKLTNKIKVKTNFEDKNLAHERTYLKDEHDLDYFYFKYVNEVLIKGVKNLKKARLNIPALYVYSNNDKLIKAKNGKILFAKNNSSDKSLLIYEKSRHNLHIDIEKERLFNDVVSFLDKR